MKIIKFKKEDCPYCNVDLKLDKDSDKSLFNWHLNDHDQTKEFYGTNNEIEKIISNYAHDFRSERYNEEIMTVVFRDFYKNTNKLNKLNMETNIEKMYVLVEDRRWDKEGIIFCTIGTHNNCFEWIHYNTSYSFDLAIKEGSYKLIEIV